MLYILNRDPKRSTKGAVRIIIDFTALSVAMQTLVTDFLTADVMEILVESVIDTMIRKEIE